VDLRYGYRASYGPSDPLRPLAVGREHLHRGLLVMQAIADEVERRGHEIRESKPHASRITEFEIVIRSYGLAITILEKEGKLSSACGCRTSTAVGGSGTTGHAD
jgi:hypothetical protein